MTERRDGHSKLVWDKDTQTLKTVDPHPSIYQETRPAGSNADEWHLFLCRYLDNRAAFPTGLTYVAVQIAEAIEALEKQVFVPGQWRCAKCEFRLTQSNLYAATGTVGPRDTPGDKCPNCNEPLWRVSAMDDRNEAFKCANETFDRVAAAERALRTIADIAEGSGTINSLPHIAKIARAAVATKADNSLTKPDDMGFQND